MRLWMVDIKKMCRKHLLGEHRECHTMVGTLRKKCSIKGYLFGLYDISKLVERHDEIVKEMKERGYNHKSNIKEEDLENIRIWLKDNFNKGFVDVLENEKELNRRCKECKF